MGSATRDEGPKFRPISQREQSLNLRLEQIISRENFIDQQSGSVLSVPDGFYEMALAYGEARRASPDTANIDAYVHMLLMDKGNPQRILKLIRICDPEIAKFFLRDARKQIGKVIEVRNGSIMTPQDSPCSTLH